MSDNSFATRKTPDGRLQVSITGYWHDCDGTLGQHPQFWQIKIGRALDPTMPVVLDKYLPLGQMWITNGYAFVQRPGMKVENLLLLGSQPPTLTWPEISLVSDGDYLFTGNSTGTPIVDEMPPKKCEGECFRSSDSHGIYVMCADCMAAVRDSKIVPESFMKQLPPLEIPAHGPYEVTKRTEFTMSPIPDSLIDALPSVRSWDSLSDAEKDAIRDKEDRERWLSESPSLPEAVEMLSERKPLANLEREGMLCYYCDKPANGLLDGVLICRRCRE